MAAKKNATKPEPAAKPARKPKGEQPRTSKAIATDGGTGQLWSELDLHDPKQRTVHETARALWKADAHRKNLLTSAKEKVDAAREKFLEAMLAAGLKKFRHEGMVGELRTGETKAEVHLEVDDEDADD